MTILHAPELRGVGERPLYRTRAGIVIGSAYSRPAPRPSADSERIQRLLLAPARPIRLYTNPLTRALRWLLGR